MSFRENFLRDLKSNKIIKGDKTFNELSQMYGYPLENGINLCKKDYYKFLRHEHENFIASSKSSESADNNRDNSKPVIDLKEYNLTSFSVNKDGEPSVKWYKSVPSAAESIDMKEVFKQTLQELEITRNITAPISASSSRYENLLVINATDIHLNKKYFQKSTSLAEQIATFKEAILYSLQEASFPGRILFIIGHDFLHSEYNNMTTRGTPQDTLESFEVLFKEAFSALIQVVNNCRAIAPVDVVLVNGNHAYSAELQLFSALEVYYEHQGDPFIRLFSGKEDRKYYEFHDNSFMLIHDTRNKVSELPLLFSVEKPQLFVKRNKYILSGHLHSKKETSFVSSAENYGIEHIQCPSLSGVDKWHSDNFYVGNKERMLSLVIHPKKGIINHIIYNK